MCAAALRAGAMSMERSQFDPVDCEISDVGVTPTVAHRTLSRGLMVSAMFVDSGVAPRARISSYLG